MTLFDRYAHRSVNATGTQAGMKRGQVKVWVQISEEAYSEIKALAMVSRRTIAGQVRELLVDSLQRKY